MVRVRTRKRSEFLVVFSTHASLIKDIRASSATPTPMFHLARGKVRSGDLVELDRDRHRSFLLVLL